MKNLKMMQANVLLEMRHPCSMGMPVYSRPHEVGTIQKIAFGVFLEVRHGCRIDYRDECTLRSASVVYILRVLNESII